MMTGASPWLCDYVHLNPGAGWAISNDCAVRFRGRGVERSAFATLTMPGLEVRTSAFFASYWFRMALWCL